MILGFWNNINLRCGVHPDNEIIETTNAVGYTTYNCTAPGCKNHLRTDDVQKAVEYIASEIYDEFANLAYLKGLKWKSRGILFQVSEQKEDIVTLTVTNTKSII